MVTRFTRRTAAVLAGVGALLAAAGTPASAQGPAIIVQTPPLANMLIERVPYADLNLATPSSASASMIMAAGTALASPTTITAAGAPGTARARR
jgi:hypothetical protein